MLVLMMHVLDALYPPVEEVRQRRFRHADAEGRVQVRAAQVRVDEQNFFFEPRQRNADVACDQALADPAFAAADRPDLLLAQCILEFYHSE